VSRALTAQRILAYTVLTGALVQFFLAGLAVFRAKPHDSDKFFQSSTFDLHRAVGYALILAAFALLVLAIVNRQQFRLAALLFVLMLLQVGLAELGHKLAAVGALHPVNGVLIIVVAHFLTRAGRRSRRMEREPPPEDEAPEAMPAFGE